MSTSDEGISVPPGTGLIDVASELEAELRSKADAFNQIDECESIAYDLEGKSIRPADSTFEDSVMIQDTCGIWFSSRAPNDQNFLLNGWSVDRIKIPKSRHFNRSEISDLDLLIGCEVGTQTEEETIESFASGRDSNPLQKIGTDVIDRIVSEIEKIEKTLGLVFSLHCPEDSRQASGCLHTSQNNVSVHPAEPLISPTLKNRVDMGKLKAFFVDITSHNIDPRLSNIEKPPAPSMKQSKSLKENLPPNVQVDSNL